LEQLVDQLISTRSGDVGGSSSSIAPDQVADLLLLWILASFEALESDIGAVPPPLQAGGNTEVSGPKLNGSDPEGGTPGTGQDANEKGIKKRWVEPLEVLISKLTTQRDNKIASNELRFWGLIDKYLRRIAQILQSEVGSPSASRKLREALTQVCKSHEWVPQLLGGTVGILEYQRHERLKPLWRDATRDLWRKLNSTASPGKESDDAFECVLSEPEPETQDDLKVAVANVQRDVANVKDDVANVKDDIANVKDDIAEVREEIAAVNKRVIEAIEQQRAREEKAIQQQKYESAKQELTSLEQQLTGLPARGGESIRNLISSWSDRAVQLLTSFPADSNLIRAFVRLHLEASKKLLYPEGWELGRKLVELAVKKAQAGDGSNVLGGLGSRDLPNQLMQLAASAASDRSTQEYSEFYFQTAIGLLRELCDRHPESQDAKRSLSIALIEAGDVSADREDWATAEKLRPFS